MALLLGIPVPCMHNTCMEQESKQKITFVLPRQLIERLRAVAKRNRRSLVGELVWVVEQYLRQQESS
jgi:Arc-like DNA binding domain